MPGRPRVGAFTARLRAHAPTRDTLPADLVAGISVGLVVIPQSLAYARIAGMPPERGLYAAALPAVAAAFLASSRFLQTGPVAITALLTFGALTALSTPGTEEYVGLGLLLAVVVGVARLAIGVSRLGAVAYLLSPPLLMGFVPAAAILICASQVPASLGVAPGDHGALRNAAEAVWHAGDWRPAAIALALGSAACIVGIRRVSRLFPSIVLVVVVGVLVGELTEYGGAVVGAVDAGFPPISVDLPWGSLASLLVPGLVIAVVGFAEPASIARNLAARERDRWNPDREFASQGVASMVSGLSGGFPVGGSFSRSALNRHAGAKTRLSGGFAGLVVLAFIPFTGTLRSLPTAVLAGVVIAAVVGLLRPWQLLELWRVSRPQASIATVTFALTLALAPHVEYAVLAGVGLSVVNHLMREVPLDIQAVADDELLLLRPRGVIWFGSAQTLEDTALDLLAAHPGASRLEIDLSGVGRLDLSGALALRTLVRDAEQAGLEVSVHGVPPRARRFTQLVLGREL